MYGMAEAENYVEEAVVGLALAVALAFTGLTFFGGTDIIGNAVVLQSGGGGFLETLLNAVIQFIQSEDFMTIVNGVLNSLLGLFGA